MSGGTNITTRPRYRAFIRLSDDGVVFVNMNLVRSASSVLGGLRLSFGGTGNDQLDVKGITLAQLIEQMEP